MTKLATSTALCLAAIFLPPAYAHAQAAPAAVGPRFFQGFTVPSVAGTLHYSLTASERLTYGYIGTNNTIKQTNLGGSVGYLSGSEASPFSALYSGGYLITTAQIPSTFYHSLDLAQTIRKKHWNLVATDSFRYLPESPTGGFAGLAGVGNPGFPPVGSVGGSGQGVVTPFSTEIDNIATATVGFPVTGATALNVTGLYSMLRFPYIHSAIENNSYMGGGGVSHRINPLNSVSVDYTYRQFTFLGINRSFVLQDATLGYTRQWNRKILTQVAAGPQFTTGSLLPAHTSSLDYTASAQASYAGNHSNLAVDYTHGTTSGSGVTYGAHSDSARLTAGHQFTRQTSGSLTFGYARSQGLAFVSSKSFNSSSIIGTLQLRHELTETISTFASYTAANQTIAGLTSGVAPLNGLTQIVGFGITYSPNPFRVGKH